ncbi:Stk1 family PASTA domain-containing Ser/Thr kinase [Bifidobacterium avesanii]|uniref:non-specific serine/threonine protein kinase n=1 Tax=Bifidobacterium avesanii TaxID=1798157 RepID=A0A7K3TJM6_9BIFI|nr:Stk1 family PASTA domain-containing Ser/Thr kinase [Bifidobacterium avesanii]KAB8290123.1 serine-threonine protein kinase [Bifidobacterium avesanii]NEG78929.1 Stk1 family PASTA domain-containing Ser/Thr kinase [Bifidobacterium avesanii]
MSALTPNTLANGRYRLDHVIGHGGMAEVYMALDTRLNRTVAVKIMRSDLANDSIFLARFSREAQSVAKMNNPNIVSIYDSGDELFATDNGQSERVPYLVMEYVQGQTLRDIIKANGPLSQRDAEQVMLGVLNALDYSHRMGIIHRDIKPGNIMISDQGMVKVMDFGIARALDDSAATMTQSQGVVGTAQYLSPEQARGESVDARSDLYSAGCVLYEMLTGRPPFTGDSAVAIAYQHVSEVATPPSTLVPGLPTMWDSICAKAMAKDRMNRYATAAEFKNDILTFMNGGMPVAAAFNPLTDLSNIKARKAEETAAETQATGTATMAMPPAADTAATTQALGAPMQATQTFNPMTGQFETVPGPANAQTGTLPQTRAAQRAASKKKGKRNTVIGIIVGLLVLAGIVAGAWWYMTRDTTKYVAVPQLTESMTEAQVRNALAAVNLKLDKQEDTDSSKPAGTLTKQDPAAGTQVAEGSSVKVWFSAGPASQQVPSGLEGLDQDEAAAKLRAAGFTVSPSNKTEDSATVEKDKVTRTSPAAGESATKGSAITLYISNGMTTVPDWTGKSQTDITNDLRTNYPKFNVSIQQEASDTVASGSVTRTSPAAGTHVAQDENITVYVSTGKEQMSMPNVVGKTVAEAQQELNGFQITISGASDSNAKVTGQNPSAGSTVEKGSAVTLTTQAAKTAVPSFTSGKTTLSEYEAMLQDAGLKIKVSGSSDANAIVTAVSPTGSVDAGSTVTVTTKAPSSSSTSGSGSGSTSGSGSSTSGSGSGSSTGGSNSN